MRKIYVAILSLFTLFFWNTKSTAQVNLYIFSQSSGTYTPITGGTVVATATDNTTAAGSLDDANYTLPAGTIPFTFTFNGIGYTSLVISSNGFLTFGATAPGGTNYTPISGATAYAGAIAAFGGDINSIFNLGSTTGNIRYEVVGTAPNREFVVQWSNFRPAFSTSTTSAYVFSFQIRLAETSNAVRIVYGGNLAFVIGSTAVSGTRQIGLRGATNADFNNRTNPATTAFTASTAGLANNATQAYNTTTNPPGMPTSGLTYTWLVPPPCVAPPGGGTAVAPAGSVCAGTPFSVSVTGGSFGTGLTYQWESSTDNATWGPVAAATSALLTTSTSTNTYYRRKITCSGVDGFSTSALVTVTAPISVLPWTENFDGLATVGLTSFPNCWVKQNGDWRSANNASSGFDADARSAPNFIANAWSATNEFIWTSGFQLTAGTSYDFSFWFADFAPGYTSWAGEVWINGSASSTGATQVGTPFISVGTVGPIAYTKVTKVFVPTSSGVYHFGIRVNEATGAPWYLSFDDFRLEVTPPCVTPTALNVTALAPTTATVSWTASVSLPTGGYQWEVRTSGVGGSGATGLAASGATAAGVTTANVTGLTPNTAYTLYVRSVCTAGTTFSSWEGPRNFRTPCLPFNTFPYTETFEAASVTRTCWTPTQVTGTVNWTYGAGAGNGGAITAAHSGTQNARHFGNNSGSVARLVSPSLNFSAVPVQGAQVTFWYANQNWLGDQNELRVFYRTSSAGAWTLIPGAVYTTNVGVWTEVELALPSSSGASDYYIAFEGTELFGWGVAVDDVTLAVAPTCPKPTNVTALGVTSTSAIVSFTSPGNAFIVEYGAPGFVPGTTNVAGTGGTIVLGIASPITVTGLTPNTAYDFYVRRICVPGVDFSTNVKVSASSLCAPTSIPYLQNFETGTPLVGFPTCTSNEDVNGNSGPTPNGGGGRFIINNVAQTYASPDKSLWYIYDLGNPARGGDDWFYLQGLNLTAGTSYRVKAYYKGSDAPTWVERFEIRYGTMAHSSAMTNLLYTNNGTSTVTASPFDSVIVDFTVPTTGVYYVGFHNISAPDQAFLFIDDISVRISPKVDVGITGVTLPSLNCPTSNVLVQARIRNYNTTVQDFSVYPVTVTATITGAASGTLTATLNTGTLAPGASMDFYLNPAFNFTTAGTYNITVATSSPDDPETGNNSFTTSINVNANPATPVITPAAPAICVGGQVQLSTQFTTAAAPVTLPAVSSGTIAVNVPDALASGATHTINVTTVPAGATVTGISVSINHFSHTWISDMVINLKAPNGKVLNLFNGKGGNGDSLMNTVINSTSTSPLAAGVAPFTGTYAPDATATNPPTGYTQDVTNFAGLYSIGNGAWTLAMRDLFGGDLGVLKSWSITLTYQFVTPRVTWTPVTGLFTNAAATTAYTAGTDAYSVFAKPATTTTYTVTATTLAGCTASSTATVTVNTGTPITVGSIADTVCTSDAIIQLPATPVGGTWTGPGVSGNTFIPPSTAIGTYTLTYTFVNAFGCTSTATKRISVKDCPERLILLRDNAVILYPNPNDGRFNIRINSVLYNYLGMKVYSNNGILVRTQQFAGLAYGRVIPIDLTNLPGGIYMVKFYYDGGTRTSEKTFKVLVGLP
ncbi:MAG: fibronectin type III domain-containing protein [Chitinophagaceae bacterium]|nr:fibronectin type III domain-containing protein [Chitinophagaceae bacterium]